MRSVIVVLLVLASALSFWRSFSAAEERQRAAALGAVSSSAPAFDIPADERWADPDKAWNAIRATAEQFHVNVVLPSAGYDSRDKPEITQYVLLTGATRLAREFTLASGRWITPEETAGSGHFLTSTATHDPEQTGVVRSFAQATVLTVRPLRQAYATLPVAGRYYLESHDGSSGSYEEFTRTLGVELAVWNGLASPLPPADFVPKSPSPLMFPGPSDLPLRLLGWTLVAAVGLLATYRALSMTKAAGVMRLHGHSWTQVWFRVSGRLTLITMAIISTIAVTAAWVVPASNGQFVAATTANLAWTSAAMLGATALAGYYVNRLRLQDTLKNRKDTRGIFAVNTVLNVACTVAFVLLSTGVWAQYQQIGRELGRVKDWTSTANYGIFYPASIGSDLAADQLGQAGSTAAEALTLYPALDKRGALYIDATQFEPQARSTLGAGSYAYLTVNPNFLDRYPLRAMSGDAVRISGIDPEWVLLVPERLRPQQAQLRSYFQGQRESAMQAEHALFGDHVPDLIRHQRTRIIWTADNQQVFSFNPAINPRNGSRITDPIVQVITSANSLGIDRANAVTGGPNSAMKVYLSAGDGPSTLHILKPELVKAGLDDKLRHLVTMDGYLVTEVDSLKKTAHVLALTGALLGCGALGLLLQILVVALDRYGRRAAVRRLLGHGTLACYREGARLFALLVTVHLAAAPILLAAGVDVPGFSGGTTLGVGVGVAAAVGAGLAVGELILAAAVLAVYERRRFAHTLKQEF